jgi:hypothetical protein
MTTPEAEDHDPEGHLAHLERAMDALKRIVQNLAR